MFVMPRQSLHSPELGGFTLTNALVFHPQCFALKLHRHKTKQQQQQQQKKKQLKKL